MPKYRVNVLLSTYNGERYIREQIDSIFRQVGVEVRLFVRDDGSSDRTIDIINEYANTYDIKVYKDKNIGYINSFVWLIRNCPNEKDVYYALSDQDDIWDKDKLIVAINELNKHKCEDVLLYACTNRLMCEDTVKENKHSCGFINYGFTGFSNGQHLQGCTMVFNYALKKLINLYDSTFIPCPHDELIMQICKLNRGNIIYDKKPHMNYRIHEFNATGYASSGIKGELKRFLSKNYIPQMDVICADFLKFYGDVMNDEEKNICYDVANYKKSKGNKLKVIRNKKIVKGTFIRRMQLIIEVLANKA